jgi:hypothetical protein
VQRPGVVVRSDAHAFVQHHRTGIQAGIHLHDGNAGFRVAGEEGALDRRGAAPARQERRVDIECAVWRDVQERLGQEQAVRGDHQRVRACGAHALDLVLASQAGRLTYRNAVVEREAFHGARDRTQPAACGTVGLRQDQRDFMTCAREARQSPLGELGRAGED